MTLNKMRHALGRCCPQHLLSRFAGWLAQANAGVFSRLLIKWFIYHYRVNMAEALLQKPADYRNFNDFFTRALQPDARPIDYNSSQLISPTDGSISQIGSIKNGRIIQAKGRYYSVQELIGSDSKTASLFTYGQFATIYLAPKDYHRIHMPCDARLTAMTYIPGRLFSVNPLTAQRVDRLFARNERIVAFFDSKAGSIAIILVGAIIVASIETQWAGTVTPTRGQQIFSQQYDQITAPCLTQGQEMGRFKLGSTVILLCTKNAVTFLPEIKAGYNINMGRPLATLNYPF